MQNASPAQAPDKKEPATIWNMAFITLFVTNLTFNMGQNMSNSLLPVYANALGASAAAIGVVASSFAVSAIAFRFISSPIMDTYNRKYIVVFAALTLAVAFLGFGMSGSITSLIGFRLVQGCGMAFGNACCLAMVSDMIPKDRYGAGIGYFSLAMVIAQALGPSVGLWMVDKVGYSATFTMNAGIMLVTAFLAFRIKLNFTRTKKLTLSVKNVLAKEVAIPTILLLLVITGYSFGGSFLIIYAREQGVTSNIGLYFTVSAVTVLITRPFLGRLTDKYGVVIVAIPALCCNVISCFIISNAHALWHFLVAAFIAALGSGVCQPSLQALSMKAVAGDRRGAASSTNYLGMDFGALFGPLLGGLVAQSLGYRMMYRFQAIPLAACMLILFLSKKWISNTEKSFAAEARAEAGQ
ncbi:MAG: MFS transporter [Clostridiales bacterium]|nr:MFS transporter [Clostridiales bacterium]